MALGADLARASETGARFTPVSYFWPAVIPRNALFFLIVLR